MDQNYLYREDLSWDAKGILAYLLTLPLGTLVSFQDLYAMSKDDLNCTRKAINELIDKRLCGSIEIQQGRSYLLVGG